MTGATKRAEEWFTPARFGLLIACLIAACFPGVIAGRDSFFFRDFAIFSYPLAAYHKACFWSGEIPLWNPYNDCGLPFLAQWNTLVLYPFSLIYLLLPLPWSLNIFCLFHFWLGGLGMYFLARSWTHSNLPAALAGLAFIFSGVVLSCLKWPNNIAALGWMPWVVLFTERALSGNTRALGIGAVIGMVQMLSGAPEIIVLTWMLCGALWIYAVASENHSRLRLASRFPLLILLVAGLSAAQLLPFLDLLQHSQRDSGFSGSQWPMPRWGWANFVLPLYKMFPSYHEVHAQPGQYWISTYYVSIAVLLLAIIALVKVRNGRVAVLGGLLLFSMWMSLGERALLYKWLRATVPGLGMMRFPIKFIVLAAFVLPLLGAFGAQTLLASHHETLKRLIWLPAVTLGTIITGLMLYSELHPYPYSKAFATSWNGLGRIVVLLFTATLLAQLPKKPVFPLILAVMVADALTHTTWQNPVAPSWVYQGEAAQMQPVPKLGGGRAMISPEAAETIDHLKLDRPAEDVMASRISLYCNLNLLEAIPKIDGFYAIYPRAMAELQEKLYAGTNPPPAGILDFMGVSQITSPNTWDKWASRTSALPLVYSPSQIRVETNALHSVLSEQFNPANEAILPTAPASTHAGPAKIEALQWHSEKISFRSKGTNESVAVIAQSFYHPWKARIDGRPAPILRANHAFQAVQLPAGDHEVVLEYSDSAFRMGLIITCVSAVLIFILVFRT